jgi:hypothetical protein
MRAYDIWERKGHRTANLNSTGPRQCECSVWPNLVSVIARPSPNRHPNGKRKKSLLDLVSQDQKSEDWRSGARAIVR